MKNQNLFSVLLISMAVLTNCGKDKKTEGSTVPVITSINVTSAYLGDTIIITGKILKPKINRFYIPLNSMVWRQMRQM